MRSWIKFVFAVFAVGLMSIGMVGCTKTEVGPDDPNQGSTSILTDIGGLQSRLFTLNSEAVMVASGAQMTDVIVMTGSKTYNCEITSVGERSFKFRVPGDLVAGEYAFSIKRGETVQSIGSWRISVKAFDDSVQDDGKSTLRGLVYCDSKGVDDVLVTDGVNFTKTKNGGKYYLESDKRYGAVYIVLPSGYDVATRSAMPQFWAATNSSDPTSREQHNFELFKNDNTNHTAIFATDIHLSNRNLYPLDLTQFSAGFVNELKEQYSGKSSVYCFNLGDFAWDIHWYRWWDGKALENATAQIAGLPCQFWSTMGNHDNDGHAGWTTKVSGIPYGTDDYWAKDLEASEPFRTVVGPTHIAMNIGNVHYILVDNINYENDYTATSAEDAGGDDKMGDRNYHAGFRPDVIEWLRKDLSYVDKSTPVVVGFHIPLCDGSGNYMNGEFSTNTQQWHDFVGLFKDFSEVNFVSGHTHVNRMRPIPGYGSNMYEHNIGAVSGIWWNTSRGSYTGSNQNNINGPAGALTLCSDGAPSGYMVYNAQGTKRSWYYKSIGVNKTSVLANKQFKTYDMNEVGSYYKNSAKAAAFINAISGPGIENTSSNGGALIKASAKSYGAAEEPNAVWINVWGFEKGDFAGHGRCSVEVIEGGVRTDITETVNDAAGTRNPIEGYHDPLAAVTYDVYRYSLNGKFSSSSQSRNSGNHIFKYVAKSAKSTLTIVYTDRFGKEYRETMQRPKQFWDGTNPYYTLD